MAEELDGENIIEGLNISRLVANPRAYLEELNADGKLAEAFPAFDRTKGVTQSPDKHAEGDVFIHTFMTLDLLDQETPSDRDFGPISDEHERFLMLLALLYHDTGKRERNLLDRPDARVFHVPESIKHAQADLAKYLSPQDLELVIEMINKHETLLDADHLSPKINRLHDNFALGGSTERGRTLLKFLECDLFGRRVSESHKHLLERADLLAARNIGLHRVVLEAEAQGVSFPVQHIGKETRARIKQLIDRVKDIKAPKSNE
ncbi:hypothetical protein HY605_02855 [Candidatus Peregrinibacteria bacterium]|nr:hypothetical protein [Candidatus Peregrinibacteria bacterium]